VRFFAVVDEMGSPYHSQRPGAPVDLKFGSKVQGTEGRSHVVKHCNTILFEVDANTVHSCHPKRERAFTTIAILFMSAADDLRD
jgi:hypothetical protein